MSSKVDQIVKKLGRKTIQKKWKRSR